MILQFSPNRPRATKRIPVTAMAACPLSADLQCPHAVAAQIHQACKKHPHARAVLTEFIDQLLEEGA
jgi:hypothetical protein